MTTLSLFSINVMVKYKDQMESMFEKHLFLAEIETTIGLLDEDLLGFLSSKSSTRLNNYIKQSEYLNSIIIEEEVPLLTTEDLLMKNIIHLIQAYEEEAAEAIDYKRQRNVYAYDLHYKNSVAIKGLIQGYIDELNKMQLIVNSKSYTEVVELIFLLQTITYVIVVVLIALSMLIVYLITARMVKPFANLSHAAEEIAKGNFNTEDIHVETEDEFLLLATAFNEMKNSISVYIEEFKTKAETEAKLKDQQLINMKMEHLLDHAKLMSLQSQINPHFLFNTINAGVQMSIMERATRTGNFLESMAKLFRYNLQKMDASCTLSEELENIRDYYQLLKARFGERIKFKFVIDPETLNMAVPPLILQPLVENAYIHGLSDLEIGGTITVTAVKSVDSTYVSIKDSGVGMDQEQITHVLNKGDKPSDLGIGIRNVRDRLELFYHMDNVLKIESSKGEGTKIIIRIPQDME